MCLNQSLDITQTFVATLSSSPTRRSCNASGLATGTGLLSVDPMRIFEFSESSQTTWSDGWSLVSSHASVIGPE